MNMQDIVNNGIIALKNVASYYPFFISMLFAVSLIVLESIIPVLPLALFIAMNMVLFGNITGFFLSWIGTLLGCCLSFYLFRKCFRNWLEKYIQKKPKLQAMKQKIDSISYSNLVVIAALPFTPAFTINILAGISDLSMRKFVIAMGIAKLAIVYFWGYIGTTFLESITNPKTLITVLVLVFGTYLISKIIGKNFQLE